MSALDQAFIRAYQLEDEGAASSATRRGRGAPAVEGTPRAAAHPERWSAASAAAIGPSSVGRPPHFQVVGADETSEIAPGRQRIARSAGAAGTGVNAERKPLSAWAPPASADAVFQPALEVDAFRYNDVCRALTDEHRGAWHEALKAVAESIEAGATLIGVAGARGGVGCTTAVVCLGRLLAEHGVRGAWLDGHFAQPGLADALSVAAEIGWEDVLAGRVGLAECMIQSLADEVALAPLTFGGAPAAEKLDALHASMTAGILRYHYDVTLVDLGALDAAFQVDVARRLARQLRLDAVMWVDDTPAAAGEGLARLASVAPELAEIYLGDIANFFAAS